MIGKSRCFLSFWWLRFFRAAAEVWSFTMLPATSHCEVSGIHRNSSRDLPEKNPMKSYEKSRNLLLDLMLKSHEIPMGLDISHFWTGLNIHKMKSMTGWWYTYPSENMTSSVWMMKFPIPSGKRLHNELENHHFEWVNQRFHDFYAHFQ